ncbi:hypothetical protein L1049_020537 [Liquidambar formosana]|uniref:DDT domain-containing protein n=1 Tax=Liquidambar formosana TaxID=63359 RepID=A0AAP0S7B1_LIQFO
MPLLKRKPFPVVETPKDLKPRELVYQVRFTKEIFRDYHDYLNRMNLYRQRRWMCKITGKSHLTYEEALVSEKRATEKIKLFPKELMTPVLHIIQFSMLSLKDLICTITAKLQECWTEGVELYGRKDNGVYLCKILKVLEGVDGTQYEVAWLDKDKKSIGSAVVNGEDLIRKKLPFSREVLKSFIRESTYRSVPWVLHDKLARKHGISVDPPEDLRSKVSLKDGQVVSNKKRKNGEDRENIMGAKTEEFGKCKTKKLEKENREGASLKKNAEKEDDEVIEEPIKYPIDDLLVQPGTDDPVFTERPSPSRDFNVPMDCVGDLLMVWDFCSSYGRLLHLWPFSLEDFENAICHKDSNLILIVESHSALLRLLIKDKGEYFSAIQERKRKLKVTLINWTEYLCDFLEMIDIPELRTHITTIKRGHYGLLDPHVKLGIFQELVDQAIATDLFREKLDENIEQRQALGATRREEALEEAKKKREDKEHVKPESDANDVADRHSVESVGSNLHAAANDNHNGQSGDITDRRRNEVVSSQQNHALEIRDSKLVHATLKKVAKKQKMELKVPAENLKDPAKKEAHKLTLQQQKDDRTEAIEKRSKEQRKEYFEREIEKRLIRTNPLGKDRNYNRYWWFRRDGRLFVESSDSKQWGYYSIKEEVFMLPIFKFTCVFSLYFLLFLLEILDQLDALMGSLNRKGVRERALHKQLESCYQRICLELQKRCKDVALKIAMEEAVLRRSTRVRAPPRESPANAFLRYVNKWKED